MEKVLLGRTGLEVAVAGLGGGGESRLGLLSSSGEEAAVTVIERALELGVNYFDTARAYGTEEILGRVLEPHRDSIVLSSKVAPYGGDGLLDARQLREEFEASLRALRTDHLDVYHLHRVALKDYAYCCEELLPELQRQRDAGALRFLGITEQAGHDTEHEMLSRALDDDHWDLVMCFFSILNQAARDKVLPKAIAANVGVEVMSAVRGALTRPAQLSDFFAACIASGVLSPADVDPSDPLGFLVDGGARSVIDAAYRFAAGEPGTHVILTGTGDAAHLDANVSSISSVLNPQDRDRLVERFSALRFPRTSV